MKKFILFISFSIFCFYSCVDMDITPKNIVTDDDLMSNEAGMDVYMARVYSYMPIEDFKYMAEWGFEFNGWLGSLGIAGTGEALNRDGICTSFTSERKPYWAMAFTSLRDVNHLIETLPNYKGNFTEAAYNHYIGEAYFVRASIFYAMAKRFGGIPLTTKELQYPDDGTALKLGRSSEEDTWDQILADFDMAAELMQAKSPKSGYSNKYVALSFKSEAMLYAGSVAKYNETVTGRLTGLGQKTGVRVIGFESGRWQAAANKYFTEAYNAAREVMKNGGYSLYKKKWAANDSEAQYQNMVDMFSDETSPENIYVKQYLTDISTHSLDAYSSPFSFRNPLSAGSCPTLDFVELFDGFDRYPDGTIRVTSGTSNNEGNYLLYDSPLEFFKNAEPRLRAYVIFPGDVFKGRTMDIRGGIYTASSPIQPLFNDYSYATADSKYQQLPAYTGASKILYLSGTTDSGQETVEYNGKKMTAAGVEGPFYENGEATVSGLYLRKYLNPSASAVIGEGKSAQPFIWMRYAEVLLNVAEAAIELKLQGVTSPDGADLQQVATDAVNEIRERAGATLLTTTIASTQEGRNVVRKERRKELAFEHKSKWDIRRWRVQHYDGRDGFWGETRNKNMYSSDSNYRFRGLYPFFSTATGKYFYDARFQWVSSKRFSYGPLDYYFEIPSGEVAKSSVIDQQPNR